MLLAAALVACAKADTSTTDTSAGMVAAPAALTPADVAGNWNGTNLAGPGDSVIGRWTAVFIGDSTGLLTLQGAKDSIPYRMTFDADSMIVVSAPYVSSAAPEGSKVTFRGAGRLSDGKLVGSTVMTLADRPDSVVARSRWEATRAPR